MVHRLELRAITASLVMLVAAPGPLIMSGEPGDASYKETSAKITRLAEVRDLPMGARGARLDQLVSIAGQIEADWRRKDTDAYVRLYWQIIGTLGSADFGNLLRQMGLSQRLAAKALEEAESMPLELETRFLGSLTDRFDDEGRPVKGQALLRVRRERTVMWLHAWRRVDKSIDKKWDPDDVPWINVPLPPGATGMSGGSPDMIADPEVRGKYIAAIEANRKKADRSIEQHTVRRLAKDWVPRAQRFIIRAYMDPPAPKGELEGLLIKYEIDEAPRAKILKGVQTKTMPQDLIITINTQPTTRLATRPSQTRP